MRQGFMLLTTLLIGASLLVIGCTQAAPAPTPTKAPAAPTKAAEPTKPAAAAAAPTKAAEPTKAPTAPPTAVPAKKVDFPEKGKTISLIVPFAAGGAPDLAARMVAPELEKILGTQIAVVSKVGAGGQLGLTEIAQAKPDGYVFGSVALPTSILLYLDPDRKTSFTAKSFQPLAREVVDPLVVAVKSDSPWKTMKDLYDAAKAKPEGIKVAVISPLIAEHMGLLQMEKVAGVRFAPVFTGGGPQGMTALLGGHVDVNVGQLANLTPPLKAGDIRILGIADTQESVFAPGVKTMGDQGYKVSMPSHRGYAAPAGTPKEIVDILAAGLKRVIQSEEHKKKLMDTGQEMRYAGPEEFARGWAEYEAELRPLLEQARQDVRK